MFAQIKIKPRATLLATRTWHVGWPLTQCMCECF